MKLLRLMLIVLLFNVTPPPSRICLGNKGLQLKELSWMHLTASLFRSHP